MDTTFSKPETTRPWQRLIDELAVDLQRLDDELSLLGVIDQRILDIARTGSTEDVARLFVDSVRRFSGIHAKWPELLCYVDVGAELQILDGTVFPGAPPTIRHTSHLWPTSNVDRLDRPHARLLAPEDDETLFAFFPNAGSILLQPLFSPWRDPLCLFVLADSLSADNSILSNEDFQRSVFSLSSQLKIAYEHSDAATRHQALENLWNDFLALKLSPTDCFKKLAQDTAKFLPSFGPLRFPDPQPQVQILMLAPSTGDTAEHLVIRGTTGDEAEGTRIDIENSICGLLLKQSETDLPFFCDDPRKPEYKGIYRKYLSAGNDKEIRTEYALRLMRDDKLIGIMNLESEREGAFNAHHRRALEALAVSIAPIVDVLEQRLSMNRAMQDTVASSTATYLEGLAGIFDHAIRGPITALRLGIDDMTSLMNIDPSAHTRALGDLATEKPISDSRGGSAAQEQKRAALQRLLEIHTQLSRYTEQFIADIKSYHAVGLQSLKNIVDEGIALVRDSLLSHVGGRIRIQWESEVSVTDVHVYCSTLLKQHIYNLLNNSVQSIEARMRDDPTQGVITVTIQQEEIPEGQERKLNETWLLTIRDNGTGVSKLELETLRRFEPGLRFRAGPGKGYALVAAQRYIAAIGGQIEIDSVELEWFMVQLSFRSSANPSLKHNVQEHERVITGREMGAHSNG